MTCNVEECGNKYTDAHYVTIEFPGGESIKNLYVSLCESHSAMLNLKPVEAGETPSRTPVKTHWWKRI